MKTEAPGEPHWTGARVGDAAIEAFRLLPTMPVYAPRRGGLAAVLPGQDIGPLEILAFSETVLGRDAPERRALLVWARAKATGGDVGGSFAAYCRANGLSQSTFDRRRGRACRRIADALAGSHANMDGETARVGRSSSQKRPEDQHGRQDEAHTGHG